MDKVVILEENCKACALCVSVCPKHILQFSKTKMNSQGYHPIECTDQDKCILCKQCTDICPDVAIELYK